MSVDRAGHRTARPAWDSTWSKDTVERRIFESLANSYPGMFSTVVGGPDVWLALRLTRLTDRDEQADTGDLPATYPPLVRLAMTGQPAQT